MLTFMLKKLFLGLLIACSCNISNVESMEVQNNINLKEIVSDSNKLSTFVNNIVKKYDIEDPIEEVENNELFNTYNCIACNKGVDLGLLLSCKTLYDIIINSYIMKKAQYYSNYQFHGDSDLIDVISFNQNQYKDIDFRKFLMDLNKQIEQQSNNNFTFFLSPFFRNLCFSKKTDCNSSTDLFMLLDIINNLSDDSDENDSI